MSAAQSVTSEPAAPTPEHVATGDAAPTPDNADRADTPAAASGSKPPTPIPQAGAPAAKSSWWTLGLVKTTSQDKTSATPDDSKPATEQPAAAAKPEEDAPQAKGGSWWTLGIKLGPSKEEEELAPLTPHLDWMPFPDRVNNAWLEDSFRCALDVLGLTEDDVVREVPPESAAKSEPLAAADSTSKPQSEPAADGAHAKEQAEPADDAAEGADNDPVDEAPAPADDEPVAPPPPPAQPSETHYGTIVSDTPYAPPSADDVAAKADAAERERLRNEVQSLLDLIPEKAPKGFGDMTVRELKELKADVWSRCF